MKPIEVSNADIAFGGDVKKLMPSYDSIPDEFKGHGNKWIKVVDTWFYSGLKNAKFTSKPGIDTGKAIRHIRAVLASWEPKHEHKVAACAYLLNEFFEDVTYQEL